MIIDKKKIKELLKSASFNTVSCLFNNLIYFVIVHYLSINSNNPSLQQNGITIAQTILVITLDPVFNAFANGLKMLYSQYFANINLNENKNVNILLYQSISFCSILGLVIFFLCLLFCDALFGLLNYRQETIDVAMIGLAFIFISRIFFIIYEFQRSKLLGMKVFGPFAYFQTASFIVTTMACELIHHICEVGIYEAGMLFILHDFLKVLFLFVYNKNNKNIKIQPLLEVQQSEQSYVQTIQNTIKDMIKERQQLIDLIKYVRPIIFIIFLECLFFSFSIILSGKFSDEYIVAAVCFSMTNTIVFKGIIGLLEALISFSGTAFASRDFEGTKEYLKYTLILLFCYESLFILALFTFQNYWAHGFTQDPIALELIHLYKYIYLMTIPLDGTQVLLSGFLQTVELKQIVKQTEIVSFFIIGLPAIYLMGDTFDLKLGGIWIAVGLCNIINVVTYTKAILSINYEVQYKIVCQNQEIVEQNSLQDDEEKQTQELQLVNSQD
ncbi:MATE efflux family protein (macronuclear) [Tetrahymena thermophila SB210]|uniref:MATE efflux family protein n=1 Tax=Tetrahymena thermophila (strain SB210) TaxID=312017 RepID=Q248E2_TETTS|nr:MATE efflux family protein [Tetrahymena thermophila SB210]EAS04103.1 MATE efflux family protein [Tetrahymena thermophila SB210]|eukprot:XP_001024348.1 MATE efflux family protein [Tetrahymena thermophila SB210]